MMITECVERIRQHPSRSSQAIPRGQRVHYLVAPAGHPNWGDELLVAAWVRYLARVAPVDQVVVDCHTPAVASLLLQNLHPRLTVTDTVWEAERRSHTDGLSAAHRVTHPGDFADYVAGCDLLGRATTLHFIGGGYLTQLWPHHAQVVEAACAGAPSALVVATGQGLFPHLEGLSLQDAQAVIVRDEPSVQHPGVPADRTVVGGDDAWLAVAVGMLEQHDVQQRQDHPWKSRSAALQRRWWMMRTGQPLQHNPGYAGYQSALPALEQHQSQSGSQPQSQATQRFPYTQAPEGIRVVVCAQSDLVDDQEQVWAALCRILQEWQVTPQELLVVEAIPYGDYAVWEQVIEKDYPGATFWPFFTLWNNGLPVGEDVRWLTTRFHPHLLASAAGCSGTAIDAAGDEHQQYYQVKHQSVRQAGSLWTIIRPQDALAAQSVSVGPGMSEECVREHVYRAVQLAEAMYMF